MKTVTFELTEHEANLVLEAVQELPFRRVHLLVMKLASQARSVPQKPETKPASDEDDDGDVDVVPAKRHAKDLPVTRSTPMPGKGNGATA